MKLLRLIKTDFSRMFLRGKFYLAILSTVVICVISLIEDMDFAASLGELGNVYYYVDCDLLHSLFGLLCRGLQGQISCKHIEQMRCGLLLCIKGFGDGGRWFFGHIPWI